MAPSTYNPKSQEHNRRPKHLNPPSARLAVLVLGSALCLTVCGGVLVMDSPAWASPGGDDPGVISVTSSAWLACDPAGVQFESTVCNDGLSDLTQIELTEKLPSGMVLVDGSVSGATLCGADDGSGEVDACPCEGGVTYLRLRYTGLACAEVEVTANNNTIFGPTTLCADSLPIELSGTRADGRFQKNNLIFSVDGVDTAVHVSCSQPIGVGSVFGPFEVEAFSSRNGGTFDGVCLPPPPVCPCAGGVTFLELQFNGDDGTPVSVVDNGVTIFSDTLFSGDSFQLAGSRSDGKFDKNNLILNAGSEDTIVHVSCSQPIGIGSVFGPFTVLAFSSRDGGVYDAPCDGTEQASGGHDGDHERSDHERSKVEICLSNPIGPGECVAVTLVPASALPSRTWPLSTRGLVAMSKSRERRETERRWAKP